MNFIGMVGFGFLLMSGAAVQVPDSGIEYTREASGIDTAGARLGIRTPICNHFSAKKNLFKMKIKMQLK